MQLQGRNLSLTTNGEDVKLLQQKLRQLGFSIDDTEGFFDKTTFQAVHALQKEHGLPATGVVDETTAKLIGTRGDALQPKAEPAGNVKDGGKFGWLMAVLSLVPSCAPLIRICAARSG